MGLLSFVAVRSRYGNILVSQVGGICSRPRLGFWRARAQAIRIALSRGGGLGLGFFKFECADDHG